MTFGYLGYIWAILGCGTLLLVFGASAAVLYGVSRRGRSLRPAPSVRVESVPLPARAAGEASPGATPDDAG